MKLIADNRGILYLLLGIVLAVMSVIFAQISYANDNPENQNYHINSDISSAMNKAAIRVSNRYSDEGMALHEKKDKAEAKMTASLAAENMLAANGIKNAKNSIESYRAVVGQNFQFSQRYQNSFRQELQQVISDKGFWREFNDVQAANRETVKQVRNIQNKSLDTSLNIIKLVENNKNHVHSENGKFIFDDPAAAEKYATYNQEIANFTKQKNEILARTKKREAAFKSKIHTATPSETVD